MRYTTLIDISEISGVYRNMSARLLYMHLALKAGYHDDDRDKITISLRRLESEVGITLSAVRHALKILERAELIKKAEGVKAEGNSIEYIIKKYHVVDPPTPRPRTAKKTATTIEQNNSSIADKYEKEIQENQARLIAAVREMSRDDIAAWVDELQNGFNKRHHGVYLNPNKENIAWLKNILKTK